MPLSLGIGLSPVFGGRTGPPQPAVLLSTAGSFPENIASGAALGTLSVVNVTGTAAYTLTANDGNRVALSGANLTRGATAWDYETHPLVSFTISVAGTTPAISPRIFTLDVSNVLETTLTALTLSANTVTEGAANGTVIGAIGARTAGSTLTLTNDAGGLFAISGTNLVTTSLPTDYETATSHSITIRETHPDASPRDTNFTITVTDIADGPPLAALTLSSSTIVENSVAGTLVGNILGKTSGSTLSLTVNAGGRFALSGNTIVAGATATDYETVASHSITIRETYAGAPNSPRDTVLNIAVTDVTEASLGPFTLTWTSAASELTNLSFSITPAPLVGDIVTLLLDDTATMASPFDTSDPNTVDSGEASAGSLIFTGIATPLSAGLTYAQVNVNRGGSSVNGSIASITLTGGAGISLAALTLSSNTIVENSAAGTLVGAIVGQTSGSTLTLIDSAGSRFAFQPTLSALTLSNTTIAENAAAGTVVGAIVGQTPGSTLTIVAGADAGGRFAIGP